MIDERTEHLITRKLDGELADAESLELNKLLIRDPQARALLEEHARQEQRAGEAIRALVSVWARGSMAAEVAAWVPSRRRWWYSLAAISAVAAAFTLAVLLWQRPAAAPDGEAMPTDSLVSSGPPDAVEPLHPADPGYMPVVEHPRRETDNLEREVIGVWDRQSRSLYLLEADRTDLLVEPVRFNY